MLEKILAISGKPGLFRLVSRGNRSLIVETLDSQKKRMPAFASDKVISLADIAMYTDAEEVPLRQVFKKTRAARRRQWITKKPRQPSWQHLWRKPCPTMTATMSILQT